LSALGQSWT